MIALTEHLLSKNIFVYTVKLKFLSVKRYRVSELYIINGQVIYFQYPEGFNLANSD